MSKTAAYLRPQDLRSNESEQYIKIKANSSVKIGINEEKKLVANPTSEDQVICVFKTVYSRDGSNWQCTVSYTGHGILIVNKNRITKRDEAISVFHGSIIQINRFKYLLFIGSFSDTKRIEETSISDEHSITITNDILGKGNSSTVYYAHVTKNPESRLSCKQIILTDGYSIKAVGGFTRRELVQREIQILKGFSHPNVTMLVHSYEIENSSNSSSVARMFMPFCLYGTLREYIDGSRIKKERSARFIFYQLMLGLRYIHGEGYIHKDIKPENVLIDYKMGIPRVVITDFGLALLKSDARTRTARLGTAVYHPPEALGRNQDYDEKVDCWAAGIVLFEMLSDGEHPFLGENESLDGFEERILNEEPCMDYILIQNENNHGMELILRLLEKQPEKRASCNDCIKSDWILADKHINTIRFHYPTIIKLFHEDRKFWFNEIKKQPYPNQQLQKPEEKVNQQNNIPHWWRRLRKSDYIVNGKKRHFLRKGSYALNYKVTKWRITKKGYIHGNLRQYLDGLVKVA
ncbi:kinase-like protein [Backusella circina FSU 941]|nr:kinase-like protein [Backusella circina FSU 941]